MFVDLARVENFRRNPDKSQDLAFEPDETVHIPSVPSIKVNVDSDEQPNRKVKTAVTSMQDQNIVEPPKPAAETKPVEPETKPAPVEEKKKKKLLGFLQA